MAGDDMAELQLHLAATRGAVDLQLRVPRGPVRLSELAALAQKLTDVIVDHAVQAERAQGRELSCQAGCGACCCQLVPLSAPEVFALTDHVVELPPPERDAVIARFEALGRNLAQRGAMALFDELRAAEDSADLRAVAQRYFALSAPCPLLVADSCSAHAHRPIICRLYNVTSPAQWCAEPTRHRVAHVPTPPAMSPLLADLTAELSGGQAELVPLPLALDWAEQHAELAMRTWPGIDLVQDLLERLGSTSAV